MNGQFGDLFLTAEQLWLINPLLVAILIPLFDRVIYPFLGRYGLLLSPLRRIVTGGFITIGALVAGIILEHALEENYPKVPLKNQGRLSVFNAVPSSPSDCSIAVDFSGKFPSKIKGFEIPSGQARRVQNSDGLPFFPFAISKEGVNVTVKGKLRGACAKHFATKKAEAGVDVFVGEEYARNVAFFANEATLIAYKSEKNDTISRSKQDAYNQLRVVLYSSKAKIMEGTEAYLADPAGEIDEDSGQFVAKKGGDDVYDFGWKHTKQLGFRKLCVKKLTGIDGSLCGTHSNGSVHYLNLRQGANYNFFVTLLPSDNGTSWKVSVGEEVVSDPSSVHMAWQLPQILILTVGEIMFSVTK